MTKRILILSVIRSDLSKSLELGTKLRAAGYFVCFYFDQGSHDLSTSIRDVSALGFPYFGSSKKSGSGGKTGVGQRVQNINSWLRFGKRLVATYMLNRKIARDFKEVIRRNAISTVVTPVNSSGYNMPLYLTVCDRLGIATVCLPFALGEKKALARAISDIRGRNVREGINRIISRLFPRWALLYGNERYLILPAEKVCCNYLLRFNVAYPESFYGVKVDKLLLENDEMLVHALQEGSAARNNMVTGSFFDDTCYRILKDKGKYYQEFCKQQGLSAKKKMVCVALPPVDRLAEDLKVGFYSALRCFIPHDVATLDVNVVISLHPRIPPDVLDGLVVSPEVKIMTVPVEKLIPLSDVFVACFSSTIRTAVRCGVPVINYDIFSFNYELFSDTPGVTKVDEQHAYNNVLTTVIERLKEEPTQHAIAFDGKAAERIIDEVTDHG